MVEQYIVKLLISITPVQAHNQEGLLNKRWKNYNKKYNQAKKVVLDF